MTDANNSLPYAALFRSGLLGLGIGFVPQPVTGEFMFNNRQNCRYHSLLLLGLMTPYRVA